MGLWKRVGSLMVCWRQPVVLVSGISHQSTYAVEDAVHSSNAHITEDLDVSKRSSKIEKPTSEELKLAVAKPFLRKEIMENKFRKLLFKEAQQELYQNRNGKDFDWTKKWPTARPFNPFVVPLPIRMGYTQNKCVSPDKFSNLELIKVQNFLHLTPPAIKKHCEALKEFCTPFPTSLKSNEACERAFPIKTHTVDYISAASSVKDKRSRTVTKKIRLSNLVLNEHARRKMIKLLTRRRYNRKTDVATIRSKRCPTRKQNSDFIDYVLTALYFESWSTEKWETRENMGDYDYYYWWEHSASHKNLKNIFQETEGDFYERPDVQSYKKAVTSLKQEEQPDRIGEVTESRSQLIDDYKSAVLKLLNLPQAH